jgi:hypothetical protein
MLFCFFFIAFINRITYYYFHSGFSLLAQSNQRKEYMAVSIFDSKLRQPNDFDVTEALGKSKRFWDELREYVATSYSHTTEEWKSYGEKSGWTMNMKYDGHSIFYLYPSKGYFLVLFVFEAKAVEAAEKSGLPQNIMNKIRDARPYAEGRSFNIEVRVASDLEIVKKLTDIKVKN